MAKPPAIGDHVTYHYWYDDELRPYPAQVTGVYADDGGAPAVMLEVDFPDEVVATGPIRAQSHARLRTGTDETAHESGTWSPA